MKAWDAPTNWTEVAVTRAKTKKLQVDWKCILLDLVSRLGVVVELQKDVMRKEK
jgi:hypothetical protein